MYIYIYAAAFLEAMYDNDTASFSHGAGATKVAVKSGIRQGDPLSPASFSDLLGHVIKPVLLKWRAKNWSATLDPSGNGNRLTLLSYADDITVFAETTEQAGQMLEDLARAFRCISLALLAPKMERLVIESAGRHGYYQDTFR